MQKKSKGQKNVVTGNKLQAFLKQQQKRLKENNKLKESLKDYSFDPNLSELIKTKKVAPNFFKKNKRNHIFAQHPEIQNKVVNHSPII